MQPIARSFGNPEKAINLIATNRRDRNLIDADPIDTNSIDTDLMNTDSIHKGATGHDSHGCGSRKTNPCQDGCREGGDKDPEW
jgi:hypothetical protein